MSPIIHLDYVVDIDILLKQARDVRQQSNPYTDSRYPNLKLNDWHIGHHTSEYIEQIMLDFEVKGRPRFYWLEPFAVIPEHIDNSTNCSLNFILTKNPAPIIINGVEYKYKNALLNTSIPHSVSNGNTERIMLKISIFDEKFEQIAERIPYVRR